MGEHQNEAGKEEGGRREEGVNRTGLDEAVSGGRRQPQPDLLLMCAAPRGNRKPFQQHTQIWT